MANTKKAHEDKKGVATFAITNKVIKRFKLKCELDGMVQSKIIEEAMTNFIDGK